MSFLWRSTPVPVVTDGVAYEALGKKLFEERKTRMVTYAASFRAAFVADVKTVMGQKIALEPWETSFVIKPNEIVNDAALSSRKLFLLICDRTKKVLISDETWELLRALRDAAADQDYVVRIDDSEGTATVDFANAALAAKHRQEMAEKKSAESVPAAAVSASTTEEDEPPPLVNFAPPHEEKKQTPAALLEDVD